jgi:viroplasmin and RNaseH domain-containing protein
MATYVVRDASGEYIRAKWDDAADKVVPSGRTPASDEAMEFDSLEEAEAACERATDRVLERETA